MAPNATERQNEIKSEALMELQREFCRAYVHIYRRSKYKHKAFLGEGRSFDALAYVEDEALISSIGRLQRLLKITKRLGVLNEAVGLEFMALSSSIKELRDMREHYDEYLQGRGKEKQNFVRTHTFSDGTSHAANAKWSVQVRAEEMLGNRVSIEQLSIALGSLLKQIEVEEIWRLPWRPGELAKLSMG